MPIDRPIRRVLSDDVIAAYRTSDRRPYRFDLTVVRLRAWLQHIHAQQNHSGYTLRHYAWRALEGQKVEDWDD